MALIRNVFLFYFLRERVDIGFFFTRQSAIRNDSLGNTLAENSRHIFINNIFKLERSDILCVDQEICVLTASVMVTCSMDND